MMMAIKNASISATIEKLGANALACPPNPRSQSRRNG